MTNLPEKKYLDSTKPGAVPVSHTSKPSIVSNKQVSYDPMMLESGLEDEPEIKLLGQKKLVDQPESSLAPTKNVTKTQTADTQSNFRARPAVHNDKIRPVIQSPINNVKPAEPKSIKASATENINLPNSELSNSEDQALPKDVIDSKVPQAEVSDDDLRESIAKKTYFLPIKSAKSRATKLVVAIILIAVAVLCYFILTINK